MDLHGVYALEKFLSGPGLALYGIETLVLVRWLQQMVAAIMSRLFFCLSLASKHLIHHVGRGFLAGVSCLCV